MATQEEFENALRASQDLRAAYDAAIGEIVAAATASFLANLDLSTHAADTAALTAAIADAGADEVTRLYS